MALTARGQRLLDERCKEYRLQSGSYLVTRTQLKLVLYAPSTTVICGFGARAGVSIAPDYYYFSKVNFLWECRNLCSHLSLTKPNAGR